jgi:hypothetical protein
MNARKIFAIMGAVVTGGLIVTLGSLTGHAEAAMAMN